MSFKELLPYMIAIISPVISGLWAFLASTKKSREDLAQLQEQNKHDLNRLINEHKLDLEGLEVKHNMEIEKIELEHKHKIELMQKEIENKLGGEIMGNIISGVMNSPEVKNQMSKSLLSELSRKKK